MIREYLYCIKNAQDGNVACKNPKVVFITGEGQATPCVGKDKEGCITIAVPDGVSACVEGHVICEDCGKCPPKPFKICPCSNSLDCTSCEKCVNGLCVDLCDGNCENGSCVDCTNDLECTGGKVCRDGKCTCPQGKTLINERGECVSCLSDGHCGKCEVCRGGECVPKTCDGTCDPGTGNCIECTNSGHCIGNAQGKECCAGNKCECCEGFVFNIALGKCVAKPQCSEDAECPECQICVNGKCQPRVCPAGTICIHDKCLTICDCNNPVCDRNSACTRYNSTTCICVKCEGSCTDHAECGESCYCKDGNCAPNPCAKPCASGLDCGPNCGCYNGKCIPCDSASCQNGDCSKIDGCKCTGLSCSGDPCNGPCTTGKDCGVNCGCLNGQCVSCDKLSCDECAVTLGCECKSGKCLPAKKCSGPCVASSDCGPGCTCFEGNCVSCSSFSCNDCENYEDCECHDGKCGGKPGSKICNQTFTMEKFDCTLKASQSKVGCCGCPEIEIKTQLTKAVSSGNTVLGRPAKDFTFEIDLLKNSVLLEDSDLPLSGSLKFTVLYTYTVGTQKLTNSISQTLNLSGKNHFEINLSLLDYGKTGDLTLESYEIRIDQVSNIQLKSNCTYKIPENPTLVVVPINTKLAPGIVFSTTIKSKDCRPPKFTWYRGLTQNNIAEKVKEVYATNGGSTWFDYISECSEGFCSGYYYKVVSDCGCFNEAGPLQAIFCPKDLAGAYNMSKFRYDLSDCGKTLKIKDMFNNCPINSKSNYCAQCPSDSQVKFILKIYTMDGLVKTENFSFNLGDEIIGWTYNSAKPIIRVTLEHSQDKTCMMSKSHNEGLDATASANCNTKSIEGEVSGTPGCSVSLYEYGSTTMLATTITDSQGKYSFSGATGGAEYTVKFSCSGCQTEKNVKLDCCTGGTNTNALTGSYNSTNGKLTVNVSGGVANETYTYYLDGTSITTGSGSEYISQSLNNGTYALSAKDTSGCTYGPIALEVDKCPTKDIIPIVTYDSTIDLEKIVIDSINGNGTSPYNIYISNSSGSVVKTLLAADTFPINISANSYPDGKYTIKVVDADGCEGLSEVTVQKGKFCFDNPADINASKPYPGNVTNCNPNVQTEIFVNNSNAPYTVTVSKDGFGTQTQHGFTDGNDSSSGNVLYVSTITSQDKYEVSDLPNGIYTFEVTDSRGCKDSVKVKVECTCENPINLNTAGIVCDDLDTHHIFRINSISGGLGVNYRVRLYNTDDCSGMPIIDRILPQGVGTDMVINIVDMLPYGQSYSAKVTSGICETSCILLAAPECVPGGGPGGGSGGGSGCPINSTQFAITAVGGDDCTVKVTNNSSESVSFSFAEQTDPNCGNGVVLNTLGPVTIASGADHTFATFTYEHLYHKWTASYVPINGDPCIATGCYTACHTAGTCTGMTQPVLECIKLSTYRRLKITNTDTVNNVIVFVNGVQQPMVLKKDTGGSDNIMYINYPLADNGTKTVIFKCPYDLTVTGPSANKTMDCA